MRTGDLNNDGRPDLAVVRSGPTSSLVVFRNEARPGAVFPALTLPTTVTAGVYPWIAAIGDINLDGRADLVYRIDSDVIVAMNASAVGSSVSLGGRVDFTTGVSPTALALTDINLDGRRDIAVTSRASNPGTVSILRNTTPVGDLIPDFTATAGVTANALPFGLAAGDLDGDGKPDLATASDSDDTISTLINTTSPGAAAPTFGDKTDVAAGNDPLTVSLADIDGDARPDLIAPQRADNTVGVALNTTPPGNVTATFGARADFAVGVPPAAACVADLNGDFLPDVAAACTTGDVAVLFNATAPGSAAASFGASQNVSVGTRLNLIVACDVNRDGRPDLASADDVQNVVWVLLNETAPGSATVSFAAPIGFPAPAGASWVCAADLSGDGAVDLAVGGTAATLGVFRNTTAPGAAAASFAARDNFATGSPPVSCAAADLNGDGKPDLVIGNLTADTISVRLNTRP